MLTSLAPLSLTFGPLALLFAALAPARSPLQRLRAAWAASGLALLASLLALVMLVGFGPSTTPLWGTPLVALSFRLDALSLTMSGLVSLLGAIVLRFSARYLDGDEGQARFVRWLCLTLTSVLVLVSSGHLVQLVLAWVGTSVSLHRLLVFQASRPGARLAARKKFIVSRLGDIALVTALLLLAGHFGTLEIEPLLRAADGVRESGVTPPALHAAALCLALAALLKSAQLPFHGWLTEVMEAPTPVSALLHAGVINAGGFLVLRTHELVSLSAHAMHLLVIVGALTAIFASLVMRAQSSVKVGLAWSTIAQMGFMLLQCGLGLWPAALVHIVGHSFYKAHAFLSAGRAVEARLSTRRIPAPPFWLLAGLSVAMLATAALASVFRGVSPLAHPGESILVAVLLLGISQVLASTLQLGVSLGLLLRSLGACLGLVGLYASMELVSALVLPPMARSEVAPLDVGLGVVVLLGFVGVAWSHAERWPGPFQRLSDLAYVHFKHGLYINVWVTRVLFSSSDLPTALPKSLPSSPLPKVHA